MSTSSSEWSKLRDDMNPIGSVSESLLASIAEILKSVLRIEIEKETFIEIGCYLYRASIVIMEIQINRNTPTNAIQILQSLSEKVNVAKSFAVKVAKNWQKISSSEVKITVQELGVVIRSIGENLSLMPSLIYMDQKYVETAAKALFEEMKEVSFLVQTPQISVKRDVKKEIMDTDLYSVDVEYSVTSLDESHTYMSDSQESSINLNKNDYKNLSSGSSLMASQHLSQYMEPMYDTFFCPLTKRVMEDPVTVESGVTYERKEITEWFDRHEGKDVILCPKSGQELKNRILSTNVALKATIEEWKERNEAARIKVARAALCLASSDNMVLEAIHDLQNVCKTRPYNKVQVRNIGIVPVLAKFLQYKNRGIRSSTMELLRQLAEDDEDRKELIAKTIDLSTIIKMLSSGHKPVRHASILLLLELSVSQFMCGKIGTVAGGILTLITAKYRDSSDSFVSEKANEILKNLEILPDNIKLMAENGYWEPLLFHLVEGSDEMKMEMSSYLGEIVLGPDKKTYVAEKASPPLIQMVQSGNYLTRNAAFKALKQISGHHPNAKILIEAGIMQIMVEEMFSRTPHNESINSKTEATAILANVLESGEAVETFQVNTHGHTMGSEYIVYNIVYRIKNSTPDELNINLIRILLCLFKFDKSSSTILTVVKESEASFNLIELINTPNQELGVLSIKLLITLSPFMGHTLTDRLCKTQGQPWSLIKNPEEATRITEKDAISASFLAKLPHQNVTLNLALVNSDSVGKVVKSIGQIVHSTGMRSSRYAATYFEGLVGTIVRLTTTLYDHQILLCARTYDFASVLTELLTRSFTDEVQKLSAKGLENLSKQSIVLSRPNQRKQTKYLKLVFLRKCFSKKSQENFSLCPVHRGVCSSKETFCLIDVDAVEGLLSCLDHENVEVIEAALSALLTLLDDKVNVAKSVAILFEKNAIQQMLNVVKEHKEEAIWQKAFWIIEKFLIKGGEESLSNISSDRLFVVTLVGALHHGDESTRGMAEKILRHLNKMPDLSNTMTFTM